MDYDWAMMMMNDEGEECEGPMTFLLFIRVDEPIKSRNKI